MIRDIKEWLKVRRWRLECFVNNWKDLWSSVRITKQDQKWFDKGDDL